MTIAEQIAIDVKNGTKTNSQGYTGYTIYNTNGITQLFIGSNIVINYYQDTKTYKVLKTDSWSINETIQQIVKYL